MRRSCALVWALWAGIVSGQQAPIVRHNVDPSRFGERVIAVVPVVDGSPLFAPNLANAAARPDHRAAETILSMRCVPADDSRFAICEFMARDKRGLAPILNAGRADVVAFLRHHPGTTKAAVEPAFRRFKRDFDLDSFLRPPNVPAPPPVAGGAQ